VFILTSLWEGLPRVIPQAMAAGVPVVANAVDGVCEIVKDGVNGFLVPPHDTGLMAQRILQLLAETGPGRAVAEQGRKTVRESFSLSGMIGHIVQLYDHLLTSKGVKVEQ